MSDPSYIDGHPGNRLAVQDDGNVVICDGSRPVWSSGIDDSLATRRPSGWRGVACAVVLTAAFGLVPSLAQAYVYWGNLGGGSGFYDGHSVGRASMDGSHVDNGWIQTPKSVFGVAVNGSNVFWGIFEKYGDPIGTTAGIGEADLNGGAVNNSFISGLWPVTGLAVNATNVVWTDTENGLGRANLTGPLNTNPAIFGAPGVDVVSSPRVLAV